MCYQCTNLTTFKAPNLVSSKCKSLTHMFYKCYKLVNLDISKWNTSNVTSFQRCFYEAKALTSLDVRHWSFKSAVDVSYAFANLAKATKLVFPKEWATDLSQITTKTGVFQSSSKLTTLDISGIDSYDNWNKMFSGATVPYAGKNPSPCIVSAAVYEALTGSYSGQSCATVFTKKYWQFQKEA